MFQCLVHKPMAMNLAALQRKLSGDRLPENLLKLVLKHVLLPLDFLHSEAQVIHTGEFSSPVAHLTGLLLQNIQEKNILLDLRLDDISILEAFEQELTTPVPEKLQETGSSIHFSRSFRPITAGPCSATLVKPGLGERCTPTTSSHTNIAPQGLYSMYHGDGRSISGLLV